MLLWYTLYGKILIPIILDLANDKSDFAKIVLRTGHKVAYYMYEDYWKYKLIFIPVQLQWFIDNYKTLYPDTIRTKG